jgi:hypothetical protein
MYRKAASDSGQQRPAHSWRLRLRQTGLLARPPGRPPTHDPIRTSRGDPPQRQRHRNAVVVSPGRLDRSPCGTGTCARLAQLHARGPSGSARSSCIGHRHRTREFHCGHLEHRCLRCRRSKRRRPGLDHRGLPDGDGPNGPFPRGFTVADTWLRPIDALAPVRTASE